MSIEQIQTTDFNLLDRKKKKRCMFIYSGLPGCKLDQYEEEEVLWTRMRKQKVLWTKLR